MQRDLCTPGIQLQHRDLEILRGLFISRVATIHHLSTLYFDGHLDAARKRVLKLKAAGVVLERPRRSIDPSVYYLGRRSIKILEDRGVLTDYPKFGTARLVRRANVSELTLRHELEIMDVRAALTAAVRGSGYRLNEFTTWPKLVEFTVNQPGMGPVLVKPDGFIRIDGQHTNGAEKRFFLEVDRSTEPQQVLALRAACYRDYFLNGGFAHRFNRSRANYKQLPFVVLMTFKTVERRNNTAERLLQLRPPIRNQVWLTTLKEVTTDPLGPIWVKPSEYAGLTEGTVFGIESRQHLSVHRRRTERDRFVEDRIIKHRIIA